MASSKCSKCFHFLIFAIITQYCLGTTNSPSLTWNISVTTRDGSKHILKQATGEANDGKLHALLGPSGSGKTTLLNTLAGSIQSKSLKLYGDVVSTFSSNPIFVQQEDLLFAQLTVKETLTTSAVLKSVKSSHPHKSSLENTVSDFILDLGLKKTANNYVGDEKTRGISGGEKKRLSIGNELIGSNNNNDDITTANQQKKKLIFCDEPTSGLDSYQAEKVMKLLKEIASKGNTVIASIHQPRFSIVQLFDEITLMSEGLVIYSGPADQITSYFTKLGYECPLHENPAEYYIDLVSIDYSSPEMEEECRTRIQGLANTFHSYIASASSSSGNSSSSRNLQTKKGVKSTMNNDNNDSNNNDSSSSSNQVIVKKEWKPSIITRLKNQIGVFQILFIRAWKQITRNKALNIARLMSNLFSALLFGVIYYKLSNSAATVPDRLGLLQVAAVNTAMTALIKATTSFVTEKLIVQRERRTNSYAIFPYFLSKLLAEVPLSAFFPCLSGLIMYKLCGLNPAPGRLARFLGILTVESIASTAFGMSVGSLVSTPEAAVAIAPAVMVIFIVFGGLYVVNTPWYLSWVPNTSLIRWSYEALCINEFSGLKLVPKGRFGMLSATTGEQVLEGLGHKPGVNTLNRAIKSQLLIVAANYVFTYLSLVLQRPSYEKIQPHPSTTSSSSSSTTNGGENTTTTTITSSSKIIDTVDNIDMYYNTTTTSDDDYNSSNEAIEESLSSSNSVINTGNSPNVKKVVSRPPLI